MSEFKGTKGKWVISGNSIKNYDLDEDTRRYGKIDISTQNWIGFIQCCRHEMNENDDEAKANALLISKALEMLTMLENILLILETPESTINIMPILKLINEATEL